MRFPNVAGGKRKGNDLLHLSEGKPWPFSHLFQYYADTVSALSGTHCSSRKGAICILGNESRPHRALREIPLAEYARQFSGHAVTSNEMGAEG